MMDLNVTKRLRPFAQHVKEVEKYSYNKINMNN